MYTKTYNIYIYMYSKPYETGICIYVYIYIILIIHLWPNIFTNFTMAQTNSHQGLPRQDRIFHAIKQPIRHLFGLSVAWVGLVGPLMGI